MAKLFNRVQQATDTTGTGAITLGAAAAGFQTLAQAGAVTGDLVPYFIEDGSAWEAGEGVYDAAGPTLARVMRQSSTGSLLNLSGAATIFVSPNSDYFPPQIGNWPTSGGTLHPLGIGENTATQTLAANSMYAMPFALPYGITVERVSFRNHSVVVASSTAKIAVYGLPNNSKPPAGAPLLDTGNMPTGTANTSVVLGGLNVYLPPALYFLVCWTSAAVNFTRTNSGARSALHSTIPILGPNFFGAAANAWRKDLAYGDWPVLTGNVSDWNSQSQDSNFMPCITLGII